MSAASPADIIRKLKENKTMIDRIIYFSLHHRLAVMIGTILVVIGGFFAVQKMDVDVFPDLTAPTVVVMTDCHGMASEEVERLVTFPIETALNGATNVRRVRSGSNFGNSFVWAEFDWGMDVFRARQIVSEKMTTIAGSLPEGITPQLAPQSSVMGEILFVGLTLKDEKDTNSQLNNKTTKQQNNKPTSLMDLRSIADWVIKPAILSTGGVSQVTVIGGDYKQYQVLADPLKMNAYGITMAELEETVRNMSQNSEGSVIRDHGNEYALRGIGRTNDPEELASSLIRDNVTIGDVAEVVIAPAVKMGKASHNGKETVILSVSKQPSINTLDVTEKIEEKLNDVRKTLPADVEMDTKIFRQADFIEASVDNVGESLIEGAVLCIIILFLFLRSYRTTIISVLAIPLSLLATLFVLWAIGMEINTMTLGGMCIAIGSLVDDAIIDVENVYKRLKAYKPAADETDRKALRMKYVDIIFHASKEIRSSIINATLIVIVAFTPMFFLSGMEGRMLKPLGITYIIALAMSLIVAMTVTPLFCRQMLISKKVLPHYKNMGKDAENSDSIDNKTDSDCSPKWMEAYARSLGYALTHPKIVLGATAAAFIIAVITLCTFGSSFLPAFNEGALTITAVTKPGTSLTETDRLGNLLEEKIREVKEVKSTSRRTGRGELDEHSQTTNSSEIDVNFDETASNRSAEEITQDIREKMAAVPGVATIVGQPLGHRIDHMLSGTRASIAIKLFGNDLNEMYMTGQKIKAAISGIEGCVDVNVDQQVETPQLQLRPNRTAMARYGITMEDFNRLVVMGYSGEKIGDIYEGQRSFDLVMRLAPQYTGSIEGVRSALIDTGDGKKVPLEEVCDIVSTLGPNSISRENVQRKLVIAANVSGRDVGSVVNEIQKTVNEQIVLPEGYHLEYGGQFESARSATRTLVAAIVLALLIIFMLLYVEFKNFALSGIVMLGLPLALIGGVIGIALSSWVLSIPSIIGFITLFGIATRNGILLVSRFNHDEDMIPAELSDGKTVRQSVLVHEREHIIEGAKDRVTPILMTALTSALALIPMIIASDKAGNEIQSPMAIVVLGGLLTSTLLNLYVMPIIYELYIQRKSK